MKCEHCGKEHDGSYGSGRFCSRSCANYRKHNETTKKKISQTLKQFNPKGNNCPFCNTFCKNKGLLNAHINKCKQNPNKQNTKLYSMRNGDKLNVTVDFIEKYLKEHDKCEICGKSITEAIHSTKKFAPKRLCIDHDHNTKEFRGLLCPRCNSFLGWYETYNTNIMNYLNK